MTKMGPRVCESNLSRLLGPGPVITGDPKIQAYYFLILAVKFV